MERNGMEWQDRKMDGWMDGWKCGLGVWMDM